MCQKSRLLSLGTERQLISRKTKIENYKKKENKENRNIKSSFLC